MAVAKLKTDHPVPLEALSAHVGIIGKTGSGKSYTARGLVELLLANDRRVIVIDPTGVWWGLRSTADGKADGWPVPIFGGDHADVPMADSAGERLGSMLAKRTMSAVVDISDFSNAGMRRFLNGFLGALYQGNKTPLHLVVDEADWFAPQVVTNEKGEGSASTLLGHMNKIVRRGRVRGFRVMMITQRPATIHKDVFTQIDALIAKKVMSPQDRKAVEDWIKGQADAEAGKEVLGTLAKLELAEGWVWAPGHDVLERVKFPRIRTYDSMRAPEEGESYEPETLADVDVAALAEELTEPKEDEPAVASLRVDVESIRRAAFEEGRQAGYREGDRDGYQRGCAETLRRAAEAIAALPRSEMAAPAKAAQETAEPIPEPPRRGSRAPAEFSKPQRRIVEALMFWRDLGFPEPTRQQLAAAAGYSHSSGGFNNLLGQLRSAGIVDYPSGGTVTLRTAIAMAADRRAVRERVGAILSAPQQKIVDALPRDGRRMSREQLAEATGYSPTSGGFNNLLGSLRTLGLIDYPAAGQVAVEPWVWS